MPALMRDGQIMGNAPNTAKDIKFDDTIAKLGADNTQDAIIALNDKTIVQKFVGEPFQVKNTNGTAVLTTVPFSIPSGYEVQSILVKGTSGYIGATVNMWNATHIFLNATNTDTANWQTTTLTCIVTFIKTEFVN